MHPINKLTIAIVASLISTAAIGWTLPVGEFAFEEVAENVYVMHGPLSQPNVDNQGFMNNPAMIESEHGLILIDPGSSLQVGNSILQEVARISPKPVLAVFNTHIHGDHWLGNQAVRKAYPEVKIYAHPNTITQANGSEGATWLALMLRLTDGASQGTEIVAADNPTEHNDQINVDGEIFRIHSMLPSHTDSDIMIEHVGSKTIFLGDNGFNQRMGRFDGSSSILGTITSLEYIAAGDFRTVVPGHGDSGDIDEVVMPFLDYLKQLREAVAQGLEDELEDYEIKARVLSEFDHMKHWSAFDTMFGPNLNKMYLEVEAL